MENRPIGIIGAMTVEVQSLIAQMEDCQTKEIARLLFHRGRLSGVDCVAAKCAPGKVNSAVCAQIMILEYAPRLVINLGVAGGVGVGIGDLVIATELVQHDFDGTALGSPLGELSICRGKEEQEIRMFPADRRAAGIYGHAHLGVIATGDTFVADPEKNRWLNETFGAKAVEMEGDSTAQACTMNGVPFAVLRAISDNANDDSPADFPAFAKECAEKSARLLAKALGRL